jgi:hypothetical protein
MSDLKPEPDDGISDDITTAGAIALLLAAADFETARFVPRQKPPVEASGPAATGQLGAGKGVYMGAWSFDPKYDPVAIYSADDFLRDKSGKQLVLTFNDAVKELTSRNEGRRYGNGTEAALRQALREGNYRDGDLVLAPREILNGYNARGAHVRPDNNVWELLKTSAFEKLLTAVKGSPGVDRWSLSGSELPGYPSGVWHVSLTDGGDDYWGTKDGDCSGIVPVRIFRRTSFQPGPTG